MPIGQIKSTLYRLASSTIRQVRTYGSPPFYL